MHLWVIFTWDFSFVFAEDILYLHLILCMLFLVLKERLRNCHEAAIPKSAFQLSSTSALERDCFYPNHLSNEVDLLQFLSKPKNLTTKHSFKQSLTWKTSFCRITALDFTQCDYMLLKTTFSRHGWKLQAVAAAVLLFYQTLKRSLSIFVIKCFEKLC